MESSGGQTGPVRSPLLSVLVGAVFVFGSGLAGLAEAQRQPTSTGIESGDYVWNEAREATVEALRLGGNIVAGETLYRER